MLMQASFFLFVSAKIFDISADTIYFAWNLYVLRTMFCAFATYDAPVSLS